MVQTTITPYITDLSTKHLLSSATDDSKRTYPTQPSCNVIHPTSSTNQLGCLQPKLHNPNTTLTNQTQPRIKFHLDVESNGCPAPKRALISILSTTDTISTYRRTHLRKICNHLNSQIPNTSDLIEIVFYFGTPRSIQETSLLRAEKSSHPVVFGRPENKDGGKTLDMYHGMRATRFYTPHPTHKARFCAQYQFFGKADDDAVIHLHRLTQYLQHIQQAKASTRRLWIGREINGFHLGMTSLMSMDLAEWIATSHIPTTNAVGSEDKLVRDWYDAGNIDRISVDASRRFHNKVGTGKYGYAWPGAPASNASIVMHDCKSPGEFSECVVDLFGNNTFAIYDPSRTQAPVHC
ncbi:hypothetical protein BJ741DRAFT_615306 [Chytriomyces cf. hyalinus JEL632]|nr:hypothetical protein BJ741DRAFT_615306 [Chytriomyces cf. hyalinus JEL632]